MDSKFQGAYKPRPRKYGRSVATHQFLLETTSDRTRSACPFSTLGAPFPSTYLWSQRITSLLTRMVRGRNQKNWKLVVAQTSSLDLALAMYFSGYLSYQHLYGDHVEGWWLTRRYYHMCWSSGIDKSNLVRSIKNLGIQIEGYSYLIKLSSWKVLIANKILSSAVIAFGARVISMFSS